MIQKLDVMYLSEQKRNFRRLKGFKQTLVTREPQWIMLKKDGIENGNFKEDKGWMGCSG